VSVGSFFGIKVLPEVAGMLLERKEREWLLFEVVADFEKHDTLKIEIVPE
jgi:hypothetical protein